MTAVSVFCPPTFFILSFCFGHVFANLPWTWPSIFLELLGLMRDPLHWNLCNLPIHYVFQSFSHGHRNASPAFLWDLYYARCFSATGSLSPKPSLLCLLLTFEWQSIFPLGSLAYLHQLFVKLLSCLFFSTIYFTALVFPLSWRDLWAALLI